MDKRTPDGRSENGDALGLNQFAATGQRSMMSFAHLHSRLLRNSLEMNAEILDFISKRVREDIRTNDELARCSDLKEATDTVSTFYRKAIEDYSEETSKLLQLSSDIAQHSIEDVQAGIAETRGEQESARPAS